MPFFDLFEVINDAIESVLVFFEDSLSLWRFLQFFSSLLEYLLFRFFPFSLLCSVVYFFCPDDLSALIFFLLINILLIGVNFLSYFSRWLLKLLTTAHTICVNFAATIFDLSKQLPIFLLSTFVACFGEKLVDCGLLKNLLSHLSMLLWLRQHFGLVEITIHPIYWWNYFHKNRTKIIIFDFFET